MSPEPLLFLNFNQADSGRIGDDRLLPDYVLACRFLHCSIIDRTSALDPGFAFAVLDPIPDRATGDETFAQICDATGEEIVAQAVRESRAINLLWSGGIDSTAALIAVIKAVEARRCPDLLRVRLSMHSATEYPGFFLRFINDRFAVAPVSHPISAGLCACDINVTGEHGDQLFGSHLLASYVRRGLGGSPYEDLLPFVLHERLGSWRSARRVQRFLAPVIAAAPVPIVTLFDYFWWLNFSLKWQEVTLRLPAYRGDQAAEIYHSLHHFYRNERFQIWALATTPGKPVPSWDRYKDEAKHYILDFTRDEAYFQYKEKEDSLRHVMANQAISTKLLAYMRQDFQPVYTSVEWKPTGLFSRLFH
jgi:hypothetical protein